MPLRLPLASELLQAGWTNCSDVEAAAWAGLRKSGRHLSGAEWSQGLSQEAPWDLGTSPRARWWPTPWW